MARREYKQRDRRLVAEWVNQTYPERVTVFYELRVGPPEEELRARYPDLPPGYFRPWMKWADAVVITRDRIILVEAEIRRPILALGELIHYRDVLKETPELRPWVGLPIEAHLVTPVEDPQVIATARAMGIHVDIFKPAWAMQYLMEVSKR